MENGILMFAAGVIILNALLLFIIIQSATKATKRLNAQMAVFFMLAKIAEKSGVPKEEIEQLTDWMNQGTK